ncbi:MAG: hypothetical protein AB8V06_03680 [Francisella endosymbiont of Hyalomma asiaticum]
MVQAFTWRDDKYSFYNTNVNILNNVYYVTLNNKSKKQLDKLSWQKAFNSLQQAIDTVSENGGGEI